MRKTAVRFDKRDQPSVNDVFNEHVCIVVDGCLSDYVDSVFLSPVGEQ